MKTQNKMMNWVMKGRRTKTFSPPSIPRPSVCEHVPAPPGPSPRYPELLRRKEEMWILYAAVFVPREWIYNIRGYYDSGKTR